MERRDANFRLFTATVWLLLTLPVGVAAQEVVPQGASRPDAQAAQQPQAAQRLFVSDKLVLNVYTEPARGAARVATIQTGAVVDALDRTDDFIRVRLQDGREGWVGANYLTPDAPAAVRLRELERQQKTGSPVVDRKSADEIARLKKETAALKAQLQELQSAAPTSAGGALGVSAASAASAPQADGDDSAQAGSASHDAGGASWAWPFIAVLAALLGFGAGHQLLASRIRRKYGALKIY